MAGFISEWWPESNRNGGRHQIGIPGRIASEFASSTAGFHQRAKSASLVISDGSPSGAVLRLRSMFEVFAAQIAEDDG